jgi:hypothetical protein
MDDHLLVGLARRGQIWRFLALLVIVFSIIGSVRSEGHKVSDPMFVALLGP